ncbi:MAG: DUF934 domain-containing protein [Rhodoferax sp.]|uniref:DUF934 domain-containing protein n=1 Tax=Rhodoferax sp. TaxID=50421 RepID=UPI001401350E|nr:DUF934 domain-containing protein [Rhodoferax sp.]NDP40709.1 DUF934 domain-containing protein [Rhodoferax sp.]
MKLIASHAYATRATGQNVINLANDADPRTLALAGVDRVELNFPKFTDGRAFSQAYLLRRRLGFHGEIVALGDVLIDQLLQMQRSGFDVAVLRADQDLALAQRQLDRFSGFYQGDAQRAPLFAAATGACACVNNTEGVAA